MRFTLSALVATTAFAVENNTHFFNLFNDQTLATVLKEGITLDHNVATTLEVR